ncbi:Peptide ABC transporter substrate-binding protein [Hyphomicrobiales bacterium]|nr:Peptide ABC transporter substrate-binding protein [Hyphomicrobiales bacterium]CAH1691283.1 Peptide ABC transporter substrate-binding protein [Hyphomicrobiales bacterium]
MNINRRSLLASFGMLAVAPGFARAQQSPDRLVFGLSAYPPNMAPWVNSGTSALTVKAQMHRGLTSYGSDGRIRPELAESWEQAGETGWLFRLRDAVFHSGKPVTAEDVKWSLEQIGAPDSTALFAAQFADIARIETPDEKTVLVVMKQPLVMLPEWLAHPLVPIVQKDSLKENPLGIGAGPYTMVSMDRGVGIEMTAFPQYYRPGLPKVKNLRFVAYADENLRVAALETGELSIIEYVPWQSMAQIETNSDLKLDVQNGPFMWLGFNGAEKPFDNPLVRQACAFAVKRDEIVTAAFYGRGAELRGIPLTPESPFYYDEAVNYWGYDPDRAKSLLKQAGYENGFQAKLLSTAQYSMYQTTAEVVQQNLLAIGVVAELELPDWATRVNRGKAGRYQFSIGGSTADNNDPDGFTSLMDGSLPMSNFRSANLPTPEIHELFQKGRSEFVLEKRIGIYKQLNAKIFETTPWVGLAWRAQGYAMAANIEGFHGLPGALNFFSGLLLEQTSIT